MPNNNEAELRKKLSEIHHLKVHSSATYAELLDMYEDYEAEQVISVHNKDISAIKYPLEHISVIKDSSKVRHICNIDFKYGGCFIRKEELTDKNVVDLVIFLSKLVLMQQIT